MLPEMTDALLQASGETLLMVSVSGLIASLLGVPLGILLFISRAGGIWPHVGLNRGLDFILNAWRSIPFIILLVAIIPFTRLIVGTSIGTIAAIVPLTIGAIPLSLIHI